MKFQSTYIYGFDSEKECEEDGLALLDTIRNEGYQAGYKSGMRAGKAASDKTKEAAKIEAAEEGWNRGVERGKQLAQPGERSIGFWRGILVAVVGAAASAAALIGGGALC